MSKKNPAKTKRAPKQSAKPSPRNAKAGVNHRSPAATKARTTLDSNVEKILRQRGSMSKAELATKLRKAPTAVKASLDRLVGRKVISKDGVKSATKYLIA